MISILLVSVCALKLSEPGNLRAEVEENVSLQAWCVGVGCVMPFTPASCLSWCDWNVDKQEDAAARGAFQNKRWGDTQRKAIDYSVELFELTAAVKEDKKAGTPAKAASCNTEKTAKYNFVDADGKVTFPGGDKETKFKELEFNCKQCYKIETASATAGQRSKVFYIKFIAPLKVDTHSSSIEMYSAKDCNTKVRSFDFPPRAAGATKVKGATDPKFTDQCTLVIRRGAGDKGDAGGDATQMGFKFTGIVQPTCK